MPDIKVHHKIMSRLNKRINYLLYLFSRADCSDARSLITTRSLIINKEDYGGQMVFEEYSRLHIPEYRPNILNKFIKNRRSEN